MIQTIIALAAFLAVGLWYSWRLLASDRRGRIQPLLGPGVYVGLLGIVFVLVLLWR